MKGFTLLELLVVVLIIGILSSVALPQYTKAVEKARATEAVVVTKALQDAVQRHMQEFPGEVPTTQSQIADVTLSNGQWVDGGQCFTTRNFAYDFSGTNEIYVYRIANGPLTSCTGLRYTNSNVKWAAQIYKNMNNRTERLVPGSFTTNGGSDYSSVEVLFEQ